MSTVSDIQTNVLEYLQQTPADLINDNEGSVDEATRTTRGEALILEAINHALFDVGQSHKFMPLEARGSLTVSASGAYFLDGFINEDDPTETDMQLRAFRQFHIETNGTLCEIGYKKYKDVVSTYQTGSSKPATDNRNYAYSGRGRFFLNPVPTEDRKLVVDGWRVPKRLVDGDSTNWFLKNYPQYFKWAVIVDLNHITHSFDFRNEDTLPPPVRFKDEQWNMMISNDNYTSLDAEEIMLE